MNVIIAYLAVSAVCMGSKGVPSCVSYVNGTFIKESECIEFKNTNNAYWKKFITSEAQMYCIKSSVPPRAREWL